MKVRWEGCVSGLQESDWIYVLTTQKAIKNDPIMISSKSVSSVRSTNATTHNIFLAVWISERDPWRMSLTMSQLSRHVSATTRQRCRALSISRVGLCSALPWMLNSCKGPSHSTSQFRIMNPIWRFSFSQHSGIQPTVVLRKSSPPKKRPTVCLSPFAQQLGYIIHLAKLAKKVTRKEFGGTRSNQQYDCSIPSNSHVSCIGFADR